ncbi:MAG: hypothetical protein KC931_27790, partial [Candidatus Omnitrophica bacterium]|nr:hypothetical protein [Candidatus Omnitrophota bacterium]
KTGAMAFTFGSDVDNHAVNTVPKETLVRVTKAEDGGIGGKGPLRPDEKGYGPTGDSDMNELYLSGNLTVVVR